jgi:Zn-dependent protease
MRQLVKSKMPPSAFACRVRYNIVGKEVLNMRLRIGSAFGVPIFIHWTFLLLPLWVLWTHQENGPIELPVAFTVVLLSFVCIVMHEFGHVLMARRHA